MAPRPRESRPIANYATYLYLRFCSPQPRVKRQLQAHRRPPRAPGYLISWAMAPSLWPLTWRFGLCLGRSPGLARGPRPWPWLGPQAESQERYWVMAQALGNVPKSRAMAMAPGHGLRPWPWLWPQAYSQRRVRMGIGYRVWGIGYWVWQA